MNYRRLEFIGSCTNSDWKTSERELIETMVLDAFEVASPEECARLLKFMRASGLIEKRILEARHHRGGRRHRGLVALDRTRAPEGIRALAEGLRDRESESGRTKCCAHSWITIKSSSRTSLFPTITMAACSHNCWRSGPNATPSSRRSFFASRAASCLPPSASFLQKRSRISAEALTDVSDIWTM